VTTDKELEKEWWDRWWAKDFSWNGLAVDKSRLDSPPLRDFWAAHDVALVDDPTDPQTDVSKKRRYTEFHLPFYWPDGSPTVKLSWPDEKHLELRRQLEHIWRSSNGEVRFDGVVLKKVPMPPDTASRQSTVYFNHAWLQPGNDWMDQAFGPAYFLYSLLYGPTTLTGTTFKGPVGFNGATTLKHLYFDRTRFYSDAFFHSTKFGGAVLFTQTEFFADCNFHHASFYKSTYFNQSIFTGSYEEGQQLRFTTVEFYGDLVFEPSTLPSDLRFTSGAFAGARISRLVYVRAVTFRSFAAFDGVEMVRGIKLNEDALMNNGVLNEVIRNTATLPTYTESNKTSDPDAWLRQLAGGARALQNSMAKQRHNDAEQWFHKMELLAKERLSTTGWFERFLTKAYRWTSDFGGSVGRPIISIFVSLFLFASLFWAWHAPARLECLPVTQGHCSFEGHGGAVTSSITFSARNVFRPFHVWSVPPGRGTAFEDDLLYGGNDDSGPGGLLVRLVSTLQSFFSIVMLFLTALAARRRFQLS